MKRDEPASTYYPILLNIQGRKCLVVGGGPVALRKVKALLEHGANVEIVSPTFCPELNQLATDGAIRAIQRDYKSEDLQHTFIAIAATDDAKTNERVAAEARRQGVLMNVADDPKNSDFIVPSYLKRGDVIIAVSTSGRSPALARKIRSELENDFKAEYEQLAVVADEVRSKLKQQGITVSSDAWQEVLSLNSLMELLRQGKNQEAKEIMLTRLKTLEQNKP
ncbi:MAG: bifunctional precorrin-2 dehydrogenase/sirohydrochlorin ferrochelatase [Chloroflexi bacterium]|nr:bifunctional precorrin-2 dehydrogenase/sirohydrochlorin ferrochelatase [Chloroflexota bacterium]